MDKPNVEEVLSSFEKEYKHKKNQYKDALSALAFLIEDYRATIEMGPVYTKEIKKKVVEIAKKGDVYTEPFKRAIEETFKTKQ